MVIFGVILHAIGGFAAGSFYIPYKKVTKWAWESYWLVGGFFSWLIAPWIVAWLAVPNLLSVIRQTEPSAAFYTYLFGLLWGVGGLTFGLSMRYLGMSLGYAIALGFCAVFGTIIPPIHEGTFVKLLTSASGLTILGGVAVCALGIAVCGWAGVLKENELTDEKKKETIREFNFIKGVWVAVFAGVMSACMAFGIAAGGPIRELAVEKGTASLWQNTPVFIFILAGGFTTNFIWCILLNIKNLSIGNYFDEKTPLLKNYFFSAVAGTTWYFQFMFYGMGMTKMEPYDFSSWSIHMAFIIVFSNVWGLLFREWRGTSRRAHKIIIWGIAILLLSTVIIGIGNYLEAKTG